MPFRRYATQPTLCFRGTQKLDPKPGHFGPPWQPLIATITHICLQAVVAHWKATSAYIGHLLSRHSFYLTSSCRLQPKTPANKKQHSPLSIVSCILAATVARALSIYQQGRPKSLGLLGVASGRISDFFRRRRPSEQLYTYLSRFTLWPCRLASFSYHAYILRAHEAHVHKRKSRPKSRQDRFRQQPEQRGGGNGNRRRSVRRRVAALCAVDCGVYRRHCCRVTASIRL